MAVAHDPAPSVRDHSGALNRAWSQLIAIGRDGVKDTIAGLVASVILIANIISFGALMFPGALNAGVPVAIWAMLIGSCICGMWIALVSSLPPVATGIDSPTGTVLVLLSAAAGSSVIAAGGSPQTAVQTVMLIFTAATFVSGVLLYGLGVFRLGSYFRFVPSSVVGGFLAATGCFLIAGAVRMTTGRTLALSHLTANWTGNRDREACRCRCRAGRVVRLAPLGKVGLRIAYCASGNVVDGARCASKPRTIWSGARLVLPRACAPDQMVALRGRSHVTIDLADDGPAYPRVSCGDDRSAHFSRH